MSERKEVPVFKLPAPATRAYPLPAFERHLFTFARKPLGQRPTLHRPRATPQ